MLVGNRQVSLYEKTDTYVVIIVQKEDKPTPEYIQKKIYRSVRNGDYIRIKIGPGRHKRVYLRQLEMEE